MMLLALDIETTGLDQINDRIIGLGIYSNSGKKYWSNPTLEVFKTLESKIKDNNIGLITHNGSFDIPFIYHQFGIDLADYIKSDTMLLQHTLDENAKLSLYEIAKNLFPKNLKLSKTVKDSILANGGSWTKDKKDFDKADPKILEIYCLKDVELTYKIHEKLYPRLKNELLDLYENEIMPLYRKFTIRTRMNGIRVDVDYFKKLEKKLENSIDHKRRKVYQIIMPKIKDAIKNILDRSYVESHTSRYGKFIKSLGIPNESLTPFNKFLIKYILWLQDEKEPKEIFNIFSNKQLRWLLLEKYNLPLTRKSFKSGELEVSAPILEQYKDQVDFLPPLLDLKKEMKLLSTYCKPILEKQNNGIIYAEFLQWGTTSGRFGSRSPNLQNLPAKEGGIIRQGFVAPHGYSFVNGDFSSLEPRCFAEVSGCRKLIEIYKNNEDLYSRLAIDVFSELKGRASANKLDENYVGKRFKSYRDKMKVVALAVVYGAGIGRLSEILKVEKLEAKKIIRKYLSTYPELQDYMNIQEDMAKELGYVKTKMGRIRHLSYAKALWEEYGSLIYDKEQTGELSSKFRSMLNNAKNFPIQGLAAHICNNAILEFVKNSKHLKNTNIVLQVHDSITVVTPDELVEEVKTILKNSMEKNKVTKIMEVPMVADIIVSKNLKDAH